MSTSHPRLLTIILEHASQLPSALPTSSFVLSPRDLLERAQLNPLNDTEEGPAWQGVLDKILRPNPTSKL